MHTPDLFIHDDPHTNSTDCAEPAYSWEDFSDEPFLAAVDVLSITGEPELCEAGECWNVEVPTEEGAFTYRRVFSVEGAYRLAQRVAERGVINTAYWVGALGQGAEGVTPRFFEFAGEHVAGGEADDAWGD